MDGTVKNILRQIRTLVNELEREIVSRDRTIEAQKTEIHLLRDDMIDIKDYWNGAPDSAVDAIEHAEAVAGEALDR